MNIVVNINEALEITQEWRRQGCSIGLVPTMGYLHDGHKSLIEAARRGNDRVVVSIFVNPIQFGPNEDLEKYPRDLTRDKKICETAGADLVFAPDAGEMYSSAPLAFVDVDELGEGLCGAKRQGHFRGVCTVVAKLFNIITPDRAYFGEKDAQQLAIIKRMVYDLSYQTEIVACPIIREADGLAMSSRNSYLTQKERAAALVLSKSLNLAKNALNGGEVDAKTITDSIRNEILGEPLAQIDYIEVVDALTLKPVDRISKPVLVLVAVYIGKTRLIDNFSFGGEKE